MFRCWTAEQIASAAATAERTRELLLPFNLTTATNELALRLEHPG
jgi:hypothetical protein